jgi:predicted nucleic acid-binding protein
MPAKDKVFFDANILVYQFDMSVPVKQRRAVDLVERSILEKRAFISSQVGQEFMNVALSKFAVKLSAKELEQVMSVLLKPLCAHVPNFDFYQRTLKLFVSHPLGFYDALIIQAAMDLECKMLYSEDLQDGQRFGALTIKNPFA